VASGDQLASPARDIEFAIVPLRVLRVLLLVVTLLVGDATVFAVVADAHRRTRDIDLPDVVWRIRVRTVRA
jgi:hypothetical protein